MNGQGPHARTGACTQLRAFAVAFERAEPALAMMGRAPRHGCRAGACSMRIIILGAGRVGESVAESLVSERNDITVIDPDPQRLRELEERLDLRGVPGNGIHAEVLRRAGGQDADMLIACASLDETNLVACKIAHDVFQIPSTIARLRGSEFKEGIPCWARAASRWTT